jgi:hypothetical protein
MKSIRNLMVIFACFFITGTFNTYATEGVQRESRFPVRNNETRQRSSRPGITNPPSDDDTPGAPNDAPIGDALWLIVALSACYGAVKLKNKSYKVYE